MIFTFAYINTRCELHSVFLCCLFESPLLSLARWSDELGYGDLHLARLFCLRWINFFFFLHLKWQIAILDARDCLITDRSKLVNGLQNTLGADTALRLVNRWLG